MWSVTCPYLALCSWKKTHSQFKVSDYWYIMQILYINTTWTVIMPKPTFERLCFRDSCRDQHIWNTSTMLADGDVARTKCHISLGNKANMSRQIFLLHNFHSIIGHMMHVIKVAAWCLTGKKLGFSFLFTQRFCHGCCQRIKKTETERGFWLSHDFYLLQIFYWSLFI